MFPSKLCGSDTADSKTGGVGQPARNRARITLDWRLTERPAMIKTIVFAAQGIRPKAHRKAAREIDVGLWKRGFAVTHKSWISWLGALIALAVIVAPPASMVRAARGSHKVSVVSFGLFGDQGVFRSEATGAAQVVADRFGHGPINVQYNSKKGGGATTQGLARALQAATDGLDAENDVLFLILTSHGSRDGLAIRAGRVTQLLTPADLAGMLKSTGVRHKVVVISACYSGVFIPRLANPDVLVITAADAFHPSFGCEDKAKWTYFGDAFFNVALRHAENLKDAFAIARTLVRKRELRQHFEPSHPQMAGGGNVQPLLSAQP
jgi:hypothetical protein